MKGLNLDFPKDIDFYFEIFGKRGEQRSGIYTAEIAKKKIWTKDEEKNIFEIHSDGVAKVKQNKYHLNRVN